MFNPFDLVKVFGTSDSIEKAMLFGSRAQSTHNENSDVDIALYGNIDPTEFDQICAQLDKLSPDHRLDLILYDQISDTELKELIDETGLIIYEKGFAELLIPPPSDETPKWQFQLPEE